MTLRRFDVQFTRRGGIFLLRLMAYGLWLTALSPALAQPASAPSDPIRVIHATPSPEVRTFRAGLKEEVPSLRGYRAPILGDADKLTDPHLPTPLSGELKICADIIDRRLAVDGLGATLGQVLEVLGTQRILDEHDHIIELLRSIGLPVDLLRCFTQGGAEVGVPYSRIIDLTRSLARGATTVEVAEEVAQWEFRWQKATPDFRVALDSGEEDIGAVRLQISSDKYYQAPGDGGAIDLTHQLLDALPDIDFIASIEEKHLSGFLSIARKWDLKRPGRLTLLVEPLPVSQWAQDNAKSGCVQGTGNREPALGDQEQPQASSLKPQASSLKPALIVPRYSSRWEEWSCFVPGDTFLFDALAAQGWTVFQSSLLFQGGNLIAVRDPQSGQRILLIGESDIYRNIALGLIEQQVLEAFRVEFGVDRCIVLPAVSYHIDYEVSIRSDPSLIGPNTPSGVIAFVNDESAASRRVLAAALDVLVEKNLIDAQTLSRCHESLRGDKPDAALALCENVLASKSVAYGRFPLAFADLFAVGNADSGVGNLQRFLLAIDVSAFSPKDATWKPPEPHGEAYARSLRRRAEDRARLSAQLEGLGWKVVPIPSTSDGRRSLNYLNGLHVKKRYLMPVYGGLFTGLDQEAADSFRRAFRTLDPSAPQASGPKPQAPIEIIPIRCGESQRRYGALRCSVNVLPRTTQTPP